MYVPEFIDNKINVLLTLAGNQSASELNRDQIRQFSEISLFAPTFPIFSNRSKIYMSSLPLMIFSGKNPKLLQS